MHLALKVKLEPTEEQAVLLTETLQRFNAAANWLASQAFQRKLANRNNLHKLYYRQLRNQFSLPSQMACRVIAQVCEAYKRDKSKKPSFRPLSAVPYDERLMTYRSTDVVRLKTLGKRISVKMTMGDYQKKRFDQVKGQADLLYKNSKWFLVPIRHVKEPLLTSPQGWIGVDLGVHQLAVTSTNKRFSGKKINRRRRRIQRLRSSLQRKAAKKKEKKNRARSVKRKLKKLSGRVQRFRKDINHQISKQLVAMAKGMKFGIVLEDLKGITKRKTFNKQLKRKLGGWAFSQLRAYIEYKSKIAGVTIELINPAYTSQTCSKCGHCEASNRSGSKFRCSECDHRSHADLNAAINIAKAAVNRPIVSNQPVMVGSGTSSVL